MCWPPAWGLVDVDGQHVAERTGRGKACQLEESLFLFVLKVAPLHTVVGPCHGFARQKAQWPNDAGTRKVL